MKHPTPKEKKKLDALMSDFDFMFNICGYERNLIFKKESEDESAASICIDVPYQRITLNIFPTFWEHTKKQQREFILHEYCHTIGHPIANLAKDLLDGVFVPKSKIIDMEEEANCKIVHLLDYQLRGMAKYTRTAYAKYLI